jgi:hypothetical protein
MNWATAKNALHAWFAAATGLSVIWANQGAPAPAGSYGSLLVTTVREVGTGEVSFTHDDKKAAGQDMIPRGVMHAAITVSCQVHVPEPPQGQAWTHATRASHYIELARAALRMPGPLATLRASNISHIRTEPTQDLSNVWGGTWRDRASFDAVFAVAGITIDTGGSYIVTTDVKGNIDGIIFTDTIGA